MRYDYIIVGAGSAGSVLATRLTEDASKAVLLLEAGPDFQTLESLPESVRNGNRPWYSAYGEDAYSWAYQAHPTPDREPFELPRGKVIGGSSSINGQVFFRGIPEDYDEWAEQGNDEWKFVNCISYFRKCETDLTYGSDDFHGGDGPIPVRRLSREEMSPVSTAFWDVCLAEGYSNAPDQNHPEAEGVGPRPLNNIDGVRMSTALTYLTAARHRLNLTVRGDVLVHRVLFEGKHAVGIEAESDSEMFRVESNEIILSGGAINSPHMLLLSGVGPTAEIRKHGVDMVHDLPGVGKNLRDHPAVFVPYKTSLDFENRDKPSIEIGMRYTTPNSPHRNDMQMSPIMMTSEHRPPTVVLGEEGSYTGFSVALQKALTAGELTLQSADPHQQPRLDYNYLSDARDRERMRGAIRLCTDLASKPDFEGILTGRVNPPNDVLNDDDALDRWMLSVVGTQHHSSGTCKMGLASDPMAVVDQYGNVHGLEGLRVVDASIMPDVVRANTNASTIMIAEKVADFIKDGK